MIKYPKRLTGCLIKNEEELLQYAKETSNDCKYLLECRKELQQKIKEYERKDNYARNISGLEKLINEKQKEIEDLKDQLLVAKDFILKHLETSLKEIRKRKSYYGEEIVLPLDQYIEVVKGENQ